MLLIFSLICRPFKSKCEVRNCRDYKGQYHFHRYPFNDEEMTKIWMEAVRPDLVTKTENSLIGKKHASK